jgi:hypothetical protein
MKKVAIVQSNYIPWKGYFDLIASTQEFILMDDVQYTRRDWRNRNIIKTPNGPQWLTVPVLSKGKYLHKICETKIDGTDWAEQHWKTISQNYRKSRFFNEVASIIEPIYRHERFIYLSDLNRRLIEIISNYLEIATKISSSADYLPCSGKSERLRSLCMQCDASVYVSGPSAISYLDTSMFEGSGIRVEWFDYSNYSQYPQLWGEFNHFVSILDLIFNCGRNSRRHMKCNH